MLLLFHNIPLWAISLTSFGVFCIAALLLLMALNLNKNDDDDGFDNNYRN